MSDMMKRKIGELVSVAPWISLGLYGEEIRKCSEISRNKWTRTGNDIGDEGAGMISEALKINSTLTELNLGGDEK